MKRAICASGGKKCTGTERVIANDSWENSGQVAKKTFLRRWQEFQFPAACYSAAAWSGVETASQMGRAMNTRAQLPQLVARSLTIAEGGLRSYYAIFVIKNYQITNQTSLKLVVKAKKCIVVKQHKFNKK